MTIKPKENKLSDTKRSSPYELILMNDNVHSFDFVIEKLVEHCGHGPEQAEQCALITHQKGECSVLLGSEEKVGLAARKLSVDGLNVDVRKILV